MKTNTWDCRCGARDIVFAWHPHVCPECGKDVRHDWPPWLQAWEANPAEAKRISLELLEASAVDLHSFMGNE